MAGVEGRRPGDGPPPSITLAFTCHNMTMAALAEYMHTMPLGNQFLGTNPVVDETGLAGAWNLDFHFELVQNGPTTPSGMLDSFEKQTGLKLEARKVPLPVIIVDSANEKPTPNEPGVAEKLPVSPTEFEVADIKPSDPNASGPGRGGGFQPGGRLDLRGITLKQLITIAWDTTPGLVAGGPKFIDDDKFDIVAKAPASATTGAAAGQGNQPPLDVDALRLMLKALIIDRFKLKTHVEDRPMDAYTLLADKPKLKKADPSNRTGYKDGPGPDGKDPRKETPALNRLVTCQNMTMAQLAELLPSIAGGYFQTVSRTVLDSTGLDGAYDFTLSFSGIGILNGGGGGRGGDGPPAAAGAGATGAAGMASDPSGGISLMEAMDKEIGIRMITTKRPVPVLVIDHIEQKPSDN